MKFKKIPIEYASFICDKLTRFKPAKIRFKVLFDDIIAKYAPDINTSSLNELERADFAIKIINSSFEEDDFDLVLNNTFIEVEKKTFLDDDLSLKMLKKRINLTSILKNVEISSATPKNVIWLKKIIDKKSNDLISLRVASSLLYPIEGVILCEGQTEYTLLENILSLYDINLAKLGLLVIPAGGKNQVARKYYELIEHLKLPIYILLDNDADEIKRLIDSKLRKIDKMYLIKSGEFEDLIPPKLLLRVINSIHNNDYTCNIHDFLPEVPMSHNLEQIYKKYGYGEFKKAQFAKELNKYIMANCTKADFSGSEIEMIVKSLFA